MGLVPPPPLICKKTVTTDQQPIKTNIYFSHFSDNFFHIFTFSHTQIQILARHGKKWAWTNVSLFSHTFFPFFPPTYLYCGDLGKEWGWTPSFHIHYSHAQIQNSTRFGKKMVLKPNRPNIHLWQLVCLGTAYANGIWYKNNKYYYKYNICCLEILGRSNTQYTHLLVVGMCVGHL